MVDDTSDVFYWVFTMQGLHMFDSCLSTIGRTQAFYAEHYIIQRLHVIDFVVLEIDS